VTPLRDALRQRHGLRGRLKLGTFDCAIRIAAGALEGAILETRAIRIQKARHALAKAFRLRAMARVFAGRAVAAEVGSAEQSLRDDRALRGDALRHIGSQWRVGLLHARQKACLVSARTAESTGLGLRAVRISQACVHFASTLVHAACADVLARSCTAIHGRGACRKHVTGAFAVDALQESSRRWRKSFPHTLQRAIMVAACTLECAILLLRTLFITHAIIDFRLALRQGAGARV